jgi:hypothetical protein
MFRQHAEARASLLKPEPQGGRNRIPLSDQDRLARHLAKRIRLLAEASVEPSVRSLIGSQDNARVGVINGSRKAKAFADAGRGAHSKTSRSRTGMFKLVRLSDAVGTYLLISKRKD